LSANVWTTASELAGVLVVSYALIQKRFESLAEPLIRLAKGVLDGGRGKVRGLPNTRLKLTAPGVYGRIPFVIIPVRRRSLGAIR
jgi:hypothetical protein